MDKPFRNDPDSTLCLLAAIRLPMFLVEADPDGRFRLIADAGAFGSSPPGAEGAPLLEEAFAPRVAADLHARFREALSRTDPQTVDLALAGAGAATRLRLSLSRAPDGPEGRPRILGLAIPVGDLHAEAEAACRENAMLRADIDQMRTLGRLVAHDLRAPLANIVSLTELVMEGFVDLGNGKAHMIRTCGEIAETSLSEITACMDRFGAGEAAPHRHDVVDLGEICRGLVALADPAGRLGIASPEVHIHCDRMVLTLAIRNLLDNAVRYAASEIAIDYAAGPENGLVCVTISDDGPGFPLGTDPIRKALSDPARADGRGIGLRSVVSLLRSRGGDLVAGTPRSGGGAQLCVTLPGDIAEDECQRRPG